MKRFLQRILQEIMKKNNSWNIRHLVDESFVPVTQYIILKIVGFIFGFCVMTVGGIYQSLNKRAQVACTGPRHTLGLPFEIL